MTSRLTLKKFLGTYANGENTRDSSTRKLVYMNICLINLIQMSLTFFINFILVFCTYNEERTSTLEMASYTHYNCSTFYHLHIRLSPKIVISLHMLTCTKSGHCSIPVRSNMDLTGMPSLNWGGHPHITLLGIHTSPYQYLGGRRVAGGFPCQFELKSEYFCPSGTNYRLLQW